MTIDPNLLNDPLYLRARELVLQHKNPSVAFLQRQLLTGYQRTLGLMQVMERDIVTPPNHEGWRRMLPPRALESGGDPFKDGKTQLAARPNVRLSSGKP